jgi:hypothetical protein
MTLPKTDLSTLRKLGPLGIKLKHIPCKIEVATFFFNGVVLYPLKNVMAQECYTPLKNIN